MGPGFYMVELSSTAEHFFIAAFKAESTESLLILLPVDKSAEIIKQFSNDYE